MSTTRKSRSFREWIAALNDELAAVERQSTEALADFENAGAAHALATKNPLDFTQDQRRKIIRDLDESRGAYLMLQSSDVPWLANQVRAKFITTNLAEIVSSAGVNLAELTAKTPSAKEPWLAQIFELTRSAIGMPALDRGEVLERRDRAEQLVSDLESFADAARTRIQYLADNPSPEALADCVGGLAAFEHALATAAK